MPIYRTTVYKRWDGAPFDGEVWSNVYHFDVDDAATAISRGVAAGVAEMDVSYAPANVSRVHAVNTIDRNDVATANPGSSGALDPTGLGGPLPPFNTIRVVFTDVSGRPEQKYLRLCANTHNIENGVWSGEFVTAVQEGYADVVSALPGYCSPVGQDVTAGTALPQVQIRQLGWHRRPRPGFHRGWVPD